MSPEASRPTLLPTLRAKLMAIVVIAALAFVALVATGVVIGSRVESRLSTIQGRYLPKVELEPQLDREFERIRRGFQDAVAGADLDALGATLDLRAEFLRRLDAAGPAVDPQRAALLREALDDYGAAAEDASRRLIGRETGEALVDALSSLQAKQALVVERIKSAAALDRGELARTFGEAARAERAAMIYDLSIAFACLAAVLLISLGISRSILRGIDALTEGLARFGVGDFSEAIRVTTRDELADVAWSANLMAASLERLERERARAEASLRNANRELEAFSYSVAHDLRAPLRAINGFSRALVEDYGAQLDAQAHDFLDRIAGAARRMGELIDSLLALSRVTRTELRREPVDMTRLADGVMKQLRAAQPDRIVEFVNEEGVVADGDPLLVRAVLENLLGNAWKFTGTRTGPVISFGAERRDEGAVYFVRDNGAGFDMAYAEKLFAPFQRLHSSEQFAGTGIGLATVQRIVHRHGGRIWADGAVGEGATFRFTLPKSKEPSS